MASSEGCNIEVGYPPCLNVWFVDSTKLWSLLIISTRTMTSADTLLNEQDIGNGCPGVYLSGTTIQWDL